MVVLVVAVVAGGVVRVVFFFRRFCAYIAAPAPLLRWQMDSSKLLAQPDVYFNPAHKLLERVYKNLAEHPSEARYRSLNSKGKAVHALSECAGAWEYLLACGWKANADGLWELPATVDDDAIAVTLAHIMDMPALRVEARTKGAGCGIVLCCSLTPLRSRGQGGAGQRTRCGREKSAPQAAL